ncbi:uncharacterized protein BX664DRAFT_336724 [Halteromyces radiatus]|uniref:uncharacterized protein n=1 Tax=Halteromyces radiatus TaxID=101107 RepID=UPI0022208B67|nr:uncharacterized protein BX664DRAFT_336724 [Halteromyces radiatus]KAI8086774.1 hypothetical protein BX664DRAFT_336724 [Halteromyces radiatus]
MTNKIANHNYSKRTIPKDGFKTFDSFYPYYLSEHCNQTNRRLHLIGTSISNILIILSILRKRPNLILIGIIQGYVWAWIGHFIFEKNKPATFKYPFYSLRGDFKMWAEVVSGKRTF